MLRVLVRDVEGDRISLGDVLAVLDDRAFGLLMLLLAFPNIIPSPIIGLSGALGVPLALVALQLALGRRRPWLPRWLRRRSMPRTAFAALVGHMVPHLQRVERVLRPRLPAVSGGTAERLVAGLCVVLAVVLALPIPFGNTLPALALSVISLGLIERDGVFILAGAGGGILSLAAMWAVIVALVHGALYVLRDLFP
ncbi:MAG: exopolysaccharide biosynthesis protein [Alphaproteobacteria bacterium]